MKNCTEFGLTNDDKSFDLVKVFSATKATQRQDLGDTATTWLKCNANYLEPVDYSVTQSSDRSFHCLTIVIFCKYL